MARKHITEAAIEKVLVRSRRRCCICFGLHRDTGIKQGQIAHLDRDSSNSDLENLAFLCLEHHDQYDSRTSQSKGFIPREVAKYRSELYDHIWHAFIEDPPPVDSQVRKIAGHYIRRGQSDSAEIKVRHIDGFTYYVEGLAFWGTSRESGPNIGTLEFEANALDMELKFLDNYRGEDFEAVLRFDGDSLIITEKGFNANAGHNVTFEGEYAKAA